MNHFSLQKKDQLLSFAEVTFIVALAIVPLFVSFPYRVNIFLSWEGAYRLSEGQIPYKDFGTPLGYMFWVIPAAFFKIFGTQMISLVKAQVFINIISGIAFRSILKSLNIHPGIRFLSVCLYCLSFSFFNFWPWYNHTVIVYEMVGLAFLFKFMFARPAKFNWLWLVASALFTFFSFFTKQDGGALAFVLCFFLLLYHCIYEKKWWPLIAFILSFLVIAAAFILPLLSYNFSYWFNIGKPPHTSRVDLLDIMDEFFYSSQWLKFYLFIIALLVIAGFKSWKDLFSDKRFFTFLLLTLGIIAEATVIQVTSYTPPDNNIFFHSFAFAFIISALAGYLNFNFYKWKPLIFCGLGLLLWWSGTYWKYLDRILERATDTEVAKTNTEENIVNRKTYKIDTDDNGESMSKWRFSGLKSFSKIYMPQSTVNGMNRLMNLKLVKEEKDLRVLNMSELTPLAVEIPFKLETGPDQPLWYHLGVAMFNQQAAMFEQRIANKEYDLVLFEYVPSLNNFYPFRVRDSLLVHYQKIDSFSAPRRGDTQGTIEVFLK
ncbi:MAG: hypothetical protein ACTHOF_00675 [Flavisolibacter sp.]